MEKVQSFVTDQLHQSRGHLDCLIRTTEEKFNQFASTIDFTAFCIIYAIVLIWFLRRFNRRGIYRPTNRELVDWKTKLKSRMKKFMVSLPIIKQATDKKIREGLKEVKDQSIKFFQKDRDPHKSKKLPTEGMKKDNLQLRITKWAKEQDQRLLCGKMSGCMYVDNGNFCKEVSDFAAKYMYQNPLHLNAFKELSKMEAEVLAMTANLISKQQIYGAVTSGGSESLIMSLLAYKNYYKKERPNMYDLLLFRVVPNTIHAAIDKGANYFNIEVRKAKLRGNYQVDVKHMQSMIDNNTLAVYASYPNYPHGIVDPIKEIAKLAVKHKIGCHIDACMGGLVVAFLKEHENIFSMDLEGVTSISLDHHKYGLAPKGVSTIFFKTRELRHNMYFVYADWIGGLYGTPTFVGSRSGFASAGAWYALTHVGKKQYVENAIELVKATKKVASDLRKIEGVQVFGEPEITIVAFNTTEVDVFELGSRLQKRGGWHMATLHLPKGIHICLTPANYENVRDKLAKDVRETIKDLKANPPLHSNAEAAFYGANADLKSIEAGQDMMRVFIGALFRS